MFLSNRLDAEGESPLPLHFEIMPYNMTIPPVGSILRVVVGKHFKEVVQLQSGSQWIKLCNMTFITECGFWKGLLQNICKIRFLGEADANVKLNIRCESFFAFHWTFFVNCFNFLLYILYYQFLY